MFRYKFKNIADNTIGGKNMKITSIIAFALVIIGALVWLLIGLFNFNLVAFIFGAGGMAIVSRIIYTLVGIAALWMIFYWAMYNPFRNVD